MNNGVMITDPLNTKNVCYSISTIDSSRITETCGYIYFADDTNASYYCESGEYMLKAFFESTSNS